MTIKDRVVILLFGLALILIFGFTQKGSDNYIEVMAGVLLGMGLVLAYTTGEINV